MHLLDRSDLTLAACKVQNVSNHFLLLQILRVILTGGKMECSCNYELLTISITLICPAGMMRGQDSL